MKMNAHVSRYYLERMFKSMRVERNRRNAYLVWSDGIKLDKPSSNLASF